MTATSTHHQADIDLIRRAITTLRERAAAATPGPWVSLDRGDRLIRPEDDDSGHEYVVDEPMSNGDNAEYIALMHPPVALAIAGWLEAVLIDEKYREPETAPRIRERTAAVIVARTVLRADQRVAATPS